MTASSANLFFGVSLLFRALRDGTASDDNLWEESIVLIEAQTVDDAASKATTLAEKRENSYPNSDGEMISWVFVKVERVFEIDDDVAPGTELFSRFLITPQVESLLGRNSSAPQ